MPESFLVVVQCMTFNHHAYIEDAMNGFCMQKTDFPYICIVMDDCSTDGEQEVIKNYVDEHFNLLSTDETDDYVLNFCQHKTNENCYFAVFYLKYNHYSINKDKTPYYLKWQDKCKYVAFCEGDDYWIDCSFLLSSVDYLKVNKSYSAVYGNKIVCNRNATKFRKVVFLKALDIKDIFSGVNMGLRNLCMRSEVLKIKTTFELDLDIYYKCAISGKLKYMNKDFAVYRFSGDGVASSRTNEQKYYYCFKDYYQLHKEALFKYQRLLVKYQVKLIWSNFVSREIETRKILQLLNKYHAPSAKRFFWYFFYPICFMYEKIFNKKMQEMDFSLKS